MYALFWDCPTISTPADAWPWANEADVDTRAAWDAAYAVVTDVVPDTCLVCEDVEEVDPDLVQGTRCAGDCDFDGGHATWTEERLRTYTDAEFYDESFTASVVVDLDAGVASWTHAELEAASGVYWGFGTSDDGAWTGAWTGTLVPEWPADTAVSASWRPWFGDAGGSGWRYASLDADCPWSTEYEQGYEDDPTWLVQVAGHAVAVTDGMEGCTATLDGEPAGKVECEGWTPYMPEEPAPCGCRDGSALLALVPLLRRRPVGRPRA